VNLRTPGRAVLLLIGASAAVRLLLGAVLGLSEDEAYTVAMSRQLSLSYFDHPPLMYWLTGAASHLAGTEDALAVRWPFVALFAGTTWLLYRLGGHLFGGRAGFIGALLLNLVLYLSLNVGGWVLPDGPLLLFGAAAVFVLSRVLFAPAPAGTEVRSPAVEVQPTVDSATALRSWLAVGFLTGLALLSKYHGVFLVGGVGLFLLTSPSHRPWLRRREPWLAIAVATLVFSPVLVWNATHDWASFRFQGGRATLLDIEADTPFLDGLAGQAVWMTPWVWLPLVVILTFALRCGPGRNRSWFLACLALGPIVGFNLITAFGGHGLPHWTIPGYFFLLPLLGAAVRKRIDRGERWPRYWLHGSAVAFLLIFAVATTHAVTGWISRVSPGLLARYDPSSDLLEWTELPERLREWGQPAPGVVLAGGRWGDAAKAAHVLGPETTVTSVGEDPRGWEYVLPQRELVGSDVLLVVNRRWVDQEPLLTYTAWFERVEPVGSFRVWRAGRPEFTVSVYLGRGLRRPIPFRRRL
jgi:4-amino-4-deoxy-L-arabinose transferase-like glycosyltransferase